MFASVWLLLSGLFYSLQLHSGSFPKPLSAEEERHYLELSAQGDLEARNILVERNLRLVAHVMKTDDAREDFLWRTDGSLVSVCGNRTAKIDWKAMLNE